MKTKGVTVLRRMQIKFGAHDPLSNRPLFVFCVEKITFAGLGVVAPHPGRRGIILFEEGDDGIMNNFLGDKRTDGVVIGALSPIPSARPSVNR